MIKIEYPLPVTNEEVEIGNPGFRHYRYRVTWKGDTVVRMEPLGKEYTMGYSEFDNKQVPVFYGKEGPGPLINANNSSKIPSHRPRPFK
jgi:hypothetical protein